MDLPEEILAPAIVGLVVAVIALTVGVVYLTLRLRSLRRAYTGVVDDDRQENLFDVLHGHRDDISRLRGDLAIVHENTERLRELLRSTLSRVSVVRYDAFEDMGGALSFSSALLDEHGNGVVVSAINGRTETRTYAKAIVNGESEHHLSPEELEAIEAALRGEREGRQLTGRRRRRGASS